MVAEQLVFRLAPLFLYTILEKSVEPTTQKAGTSVSALDALATAQLIFLGL